jgi:hypothetical protein
MIEEKSLCISPMSGKGHGTSSLRKGEGIKGTMTNLKKVEVK